MAASENRNLAFLRKLRWLGLVEGVSTLVLFGVAMPLKYFADIPLAVTIVGAVHGLLFTLLSAAFLWAIKAVPIDLELSLAGIGAAIVPFGPFVVDRWLKQLEEKLKWN